LWNLEVEYGTIPLHNRTKRYEVFIEETEMLSVNLVSCAGKVDLEMSHDVTVSNQTENFSMVSGNNGVIQGLIPQAEGKYYLTVTSIETSPLINATMFEI
jgi:hypothetical protein